MLHGEVINNNIAIIDDDIEFLSELKNMLESTGYVISAFSDSLVGFQGIRKMRPDLLLLDIKMDGLSGIQLAALIRLSTETKRIPIIFISGNFNEYDIRDLMKICNVRHCLEKPLDPDKLLNVIKNILMPVVLAEAPRCE